MPGRSTTFQALALVGEGALRPHDGLARPVAGVLPQAGEGVEDGALCRHSDCRPARPGCPIFQGSGRGAAGCRRGAARSRRTSRARATASRHLRAGVGAVALDPDPRSLLAAQRHQRALDAVGNGIAGRADQLGHDLGALDDPEVEQPAALGSLAGPARSPRRARARPAARHAASPRAPRRARPAPARGRSRCAPQSDSSVHSRPPGAYTDALVRARNDLQAAAEHEAVGEQRVVDLRRLVLSMCTISTARPRAPRPGSPTPRAGGMPPAASGMGSPCGSQAGLCRAARPGRRPAPRTACASTRSAWSCHCVGGTPGTVGQVALPQPVDPHDPHGRACALGGERRPVRLHPQQPPCGRGGSAAPRAPSPDGTREMPGEAVDRARLLLLPAGEHVLQRILEPDPLAQTGELQPARQQAAASATAARPSSRHRPAKIASANPGSTMGIRSARRVQNHSNLFFDYSKHEYVDAENATSQAALSRERNDAAAIEYGRELSEKPSTRRRRPSASAGGSSRWGRWPRRSRSSPAPPRPWSKALAESGLVHYEPYAGVRLTSGRREAGGARAPAAPVDSSCSSSRCSA